MPLLGQIVVNQFLAGALEAVGAFFQGHQGGVADDDSGVGALQHGVQVGGHGQKGHLGVVPVVEEDAGVGQGGAAGHVRGHRAQGSQRLAGSPDQQQRPDPALGGDHATRQNAQAGMGGQGGDGDQADVGRARREPVGALGRKHAINLIALGERSFEWRMLEIPHQRRGIEKTDGGDAQTG